MANRTAVQSHDLEFSPSGKQRVPAKRRPPRKPPRKKPPVREPVTKPAVEEPPPLGKSPIREPPDPEANSVAGVPLTHPDRVLFPEERLTKLELARYMKSVSGLMLPHVEGRPLMLLRCPEGRGRECFFQKHPSGTVHRSLMPVPIRESSGKRETYLTVRDAAGLVALIQMGALEAHVWGALAEDTEKPDRVVFDLDPDPAVAWPFVIQTAHRLRERLQALGLVSFVKTTGGKGIHVVVPIRRGPGWEEVKALSAGIASEFARLDPELFTTNMAKARRGGRIFIDTLRNRRGATWIAPYSPRARAGAPVSTPLDWSELTPRIRSEQFTVKTLLRRIDGRSKDAWSGMASVRQTITAAMVRSLRSNRS